MKPDLKKTYTKLMEEIMSQPSIKPEEIPNIDVYMDQLTTFMDEHLRAYTRNPERDKVLTKTMINNYTKNKLLPPPHKKKYSPEHLILLIYIFYLKRNFSIEDIRSFITPLKRLMEEENGNIPLKDVYAESLLWSEEEWESIRSETDRLFEKASDSFPELEEPMRSELRLFSFLQLMVLEIHVRQVLIEKLIDVYREDV